MRFCATKAAGSFECSKPGALELLILMEADPHTLSYAEFNFEDALSPRQARELADLPAYLLRHRTGLFVVCAKPRNLRPTPHHLSCWELLDAVLAGRGIWLLDTTPDQLRREPQWSNALQIAYCARADLTAADQERVTAYLAAVGQASLRTCMKLCDSSIDSFDALLRLISTGVLFLDQPDDLSLGSTVRLNPPETPTIDWLPSSDRRSISIR